MMRGGGGSWSWEQWKLRASWDYLSRRASLLVRKVVFSSAGQQVRRRCTPAVALALFSPVLFLILHLYQVATGLRSK